MIRPALSILKILAYFDLFNYPLTEKEILEFLPGGPGERNNVEALGELHVAGYIFRVDYFYALREDPLLAAERLKGNDRARTLLKIAGHTSKLLSKFPYVRGIGISGSLSKNCATVNGDIDYFIITRADRLWIARTWMHLFKKCTYLAHKQHWYCMNYYIDESALQIKEKNIFTAMEIITLIPMSGDGVLQQFFDANDWTKGYFPDRPKSTPLRTTNGPPWGGKKIVERLLNNRFGTWLDNYLMKVTTRRWAKKENRLNMNGNRMGIETGKHFCKPNPHFLQAKILGMYQNRLKDLALKHALPVDQLL